MKKYNYAKINLSLNVTNKNKPKDFHDLDMINFVINLKDIVSIKFIENNDNIITISSNDLSVPTDKSNIVFKVIEKFKKTFKLSFSCNVYIKKNIPSLAGLAGGTGNGAATLNILAPIPRTNPSDLYSIAGDTIELENPVIGTIEPAPANLPILS